MALTGTTARPLDYAPDSTGPSPRRPSRGRRIADWTVRGLLALAFVGAGATKLIGVEQSVAVFEAIRAEHGIGMWFMYVTAALEIGGGLLILSPSRARLAALTLAAVAFGALVTNLFVVPSPPFAATVLLALCLAVLWLRRPRSA